SSFKSLYVYNEAHQPTETLEDRYESYPADNQASTEADLTNGRGYAAWVGRGAPFTIEVTGTPATGDIPVQVTAQSPDGLNDGWNLIGNPYPAPIDWNNVTIPGGVTGMIAV